jgi:hypothetical protein
MKLALIKKKLYETSKKKPCMVILQEYFLKLLIINCYSLLIEFELKYII